MWHKHIYIVSACSRLSVSESRGGIVWFEGSPSTVEVCACEVSLACRWGSDAVFQSLREDRTVEERRREGWEKRLRQARKTSPSSRYRVKQSGDKRCSLDLHRSSIWWGSIQIHTAKFTTLNVVSVFPVKKDRFPPPHTNDAPRSILVFGFINQTLLHTIISILAQTILYNWIWILMTGTVKGMKRSRTERSSKNKTKKSILKSPVTMREP